MAAFLRIPGCLFLLAGALAQEPAETALTLLAKDGTQVNGTVRLATMAVKTKYGDLKIEPSSIILMRQSADGGWVIVTKTGQVSGKLDLDKLEVKTAAGTLKFDLPTVQQIMFPPSGGPAPAPAAPPAPAAAKPEPPRKEPPLRGLEYRKTHDPARELSRGAFPSLLLGSGKHAAILNAADDECIFVELATGACTRAKVEGGPCSIAEKDGKIYVANRKTSSLSLFDAATLQPRGRVALGVAPVWVSAPVLGNVLYVLTGSEQARILSLDTRADKVLGSFSRVGSLVLPQSFITASPDNRFLVVQDEYARPSVYWLNGPRLIYTEIQQTGGGPGPISFDFTGGRLYAGSRMYSLDLKQVQGSDLNCGILAPHPSKSLIFGVRRGTPRAGYWTDSSVVVFDEEKMTALAQIDVGDPVLSLLAAENTLFAVGPTRIYPIDLQGRLPAEAMARAKARRVPADLSRPVPLADVKKAESLVQEAQKSLEAGQVEDARKKFDAAFQVDPLGRGCLGTGMILVHQKSFLEAVDALRPALSYPFRELGGTIQAYGQLGMALTGLQRHDEAIQLHWDAWKIDPENALNLRGLGNAQFAGGSRSAAWISWSRSLLADSKQADLKKKADELVRSIAKETTGKCPTCEGTGKHEVKIEEEGKSKQKVSTECRMCKGCGKTWKRPCVECMGTGLSGTRSTCDKCIGSGFLYEPANSNY